MQELVLAQRLGFHATVRSDATPNLSPKGTTTVWDEDHLVFADIASPGTIANLRVNPAIEINVVDPIVRKGYRFKGQGRVLTGGPLFERIVEFYGRERGTDLARVRAAVLVHVQSAEALTSPAYDTGASELEVAQRWRRHHLRLQPSSRRDEPGAARRSADEPPAAHRSTA
jgi:uncharacterized protein